jgi:hypothetical protein
MHISIDAPSYSMHMPPKRGNRYTSTHLTTHTIGLFCSFGPDLIHSEMTPV